MRYFSLLDFQYVILLVFLGLIVIILLYVAFGSDVFTRERREKPQELENYPDGIQVRNKPIPPILIFIYVGFVIWAIVYVLMIGVRGRPF
ncbi:MAG: hypothetical protein V3W19_11570 [Desulfatiglandales bacterium]